MNVMELLDALDIELRRVFTCPLPEYELVLYELTRGPLPGSVEALRFDPAMALLRKMEQVESVLRTRPVRLRRPASTALIHERRSASGGAVPLGEREANPC
jgi:hypothetical protein